jgi:hypothetical protein
LRHRQRAAFSTSEDVCVAEIAWTLKEAACALTPMTAQNSTAAAAATIHVIVRTGIAPCSLRLTDQRGRLWFLALLFLSGAACCLRLAHERRTTGRKRVVRLLSRASQTRANDARQHHGRWAWRNHQVGIFIRRPKSRPLHARAHSRVWLVLATSLRCRSREFAKSGGSITVRHSRVRPTIHSGQYGLSTCHQPTMAGMSQTKHDLWR